MHQAIKYIVKVNSYVTHEGNGSFRHQCGTRSNSCDAGTKFRMLGIRKLIGIRRQYLPTRMYCLWECQKSTTTAVHGAACFQETSPPDPFPPKSAVSKAQERIHQRYTRPSLARCVWFSGLRHRTSRDSCIVDRETAVDASSGPILLSRCWRRMGVFDLARWR